MVKIQRQTLIGLALFLLALGLRAIFLGSQSLWMDEAFCVALASRGLREIPLLLQLDNKPPLFHLFLHFLLLGGKTAAYLRFPMAVFGAVTALLVWQLAKRTAGEKAGWLSGLFWGISFFVLQHEIQILMYAQAALFTVGASLYLWKSYVDPRWQNRLIYLIFASLALYSHYFAGLVVLGHILFLLVKGRFRLAAAFSTSLAVLFLPWAPYFARQLFAGDFGLLGRMSPFAISYTFSMLLGLWNFFHTVEWVFFFTVLGAGLCLWGAYLLLRKSKDEGLFLSIMAFSTFLLPLTVTELTSIHIFYPRYLIFFAPYFYILFFFAMTRLKSDSLFFFTAAAALAARGILLANHALPFSRMEGSVDLLLAALPVLYAIFKKRGKMNGINTGVPFRVPMLALIISANLAIWFLYNTGASFQRQDWRRAAAILRAEYRPGDIVFIGQRMAIYPIWYYLEDRFPLAFDIAADHPKERTSRMQSPIRWFPLEGKVSIPMLKRFVKTNRRIWLVLCQYELDDPERAAEKWVATHCIFLKAYDLPSLNGENHIRIYLVTSKQGGEH